MKGYISRRWLVCSLEYMRWRTNTNSSSQDVVGVLRNTNNGNNNCEK
ncbi:MAG: hypothetical protein LBE82_08950 [Chitinophagaceae bacterium]|nr:hypothetical protein [Chitinophagaceae bacterium]